MLFIILIHWGYNKINTTFSSDTYLALSSL